MQSLKQSVTDFESQEWKDVKRQLNQTLKNCNETSSGELKGITECKIYFL